MGLVDREYMRDGYREGKHEVACTCKDCVDDRLNRLNTRHIPIRTNILKPISANRKKLIFGKQDNMLRNLSLAVCSVFAVVLIISGLLYLFGRIS